MNYSTLIHEAWATTWRYRFLWVLGLFAGVTGGSMSLGRSSWPDWPAPAAWGADQQAILQRAEGWVAANLPLVIGLAIAGVLLGIALSVLSVIARGGITQATIDLQSGQPTSLGHAWRAGTRWFWRFLGLLILLAVLASVVVGSVVLAAMSLGGAAALFGAVSLTVGVVASIVLAYAERAIVIHDLGPIAALRHGWRVFSSHLSTSLLTWVVSLLLSAGAGAIAATAIGSLVLLFGGVGVALWLTSGLSAALILNAGVAGAAVIALLIVLAAIANTFFWSYWTLAFMRLDSPTTA
jgi:hypothetical protein